MMNTIPYHEYKLVATYNEYYIMSSYKSFTMNISGAQKSLCRGHFIFEGPL